jgi:PKD repeat protein
VERGQKIILKINLEEVIMKRMNSLVAFAIVLASFCIVVMPASAEDISANFSASPTSGYAPLTVGFHDQSPGSPTAWKWSFGDGSPLVMGYNPTHTYTKAGVYTVKETVSNSIGKDTQIRTNYITVSNPESQPTADFSASPASGKTPLKVKFTDKSTGSPTAWKWSFGDGSPLVMGYNPTHTYTKAGVYTVKETVSNSVGKDTEIKTNYINVKASVQKPVAAFTASPLSGKKSLTVKFTDKSTGLITSRSWNFGDKSTSTVKNPVHKYTKAGKYTVTLTVKNTAGSNIAKKTNYITVK